MAFNSRKTLTGDYLTIAKTAKIEGDLHVEGKLKMDTLDVLFADVEVYHATNAKPDHESGVRQEASFTAVDGFLPGTLVYVGPFNKLDSTSSTSADAVTAVKGKFLVAPSGTVGPTFGTLQLNAGTVEFEFA